jgi:hypothetical protein
MLIDCIASRTMCGISKLPLHLTLHSLWYSFYSKEESCGHTASAFGWRHRGDRRIRNTCRCHNDRSGGATKLRAVRDDMSYIMSLEGDIPDDVSDIVHTVLVEVRESALFRRGNQVLQNNNYKSSKRRNWYEVNKQAYELASKLEAFCEYLESTWFLGTDFPAKLTVIPIAAATVRTCTESNVQ